MSADNGSYVVKTPARNGLAFEYRAGHAQAIENAEWPVIGVRNQYLANAFGASWVFARERRAVAFANVIEDEVEALCNGWGTEYGVAVIPVDTPFPGAADVKPSFGADDGVYVLKTLSPWGEGYIWRVAYGQGIGADVQQLLSGGGRLLELHASVDNLLSTFGQRRSMIFSSRGRAMRAAHLINDDIVSRGGATAHGVVRLELPFEL
ncbi:MAG: hypothetical protein EKK48_13275 [Candidatus Melainabacteria bacterium]|nr:MAG: hypothetical protein EKK48_13275 [Candidatus Melainabacteria bacterium]